LKPEQVFYYVVLGLAILVAIVFTGLVFLTGKGDAMSGGGGAVRTTFKGKASFDDQISRVTLGLGITFMALMLLLDVVATRAFK
jgi:preprotein translocase subunit SecG